MSYIVSTTCAVDLNKELLEKNDIYSMSYKFIVNNIEYDDDFFQSYPVEKFYNDIADDIKITTSQMGYGRYLEYFENFLKQGIDVMQLALSSGITGDTMTAMSVAKELNEKYENNKVYVIDTLCASSGYGMLVLKAAENKKSGMSLEDNIKYIEEYKYKIQHWFISTDLTYYVRGGRISGVEGFFGKAFKICPLLFVDDNGRLTPYEKIRTKTRALEGQLNKMVELADNGLEYSDRVFICHSQAYDDAIELANMIKDKFSNINEVLLFNIGASIGAHTGPDTISLFFVGKDRREMMKEDF